MSGRIKFECARLFRAIHQVQVQVHGPTASERPQLYSQISSRTTTMLIVVDILLGNFVLFVSRMCLIRVYLVAAIYICGTGASEERFQPFRTSHPSCYRPDKCIESIPKIWIVQQAPGLAIGMYNLTFGWIYPSLP